MPQQQRSMFTISIKKEYNDVAHRRLQLYIFDSYKLLIIFVCQDLGNLAETGLCVRDAVVMKESLRPKSSSLQVE